MVSETPLISIVVPTRNRLSCLRDLFQDLQAQTWEHWECLFVDDHSRDGTGDWLRRTTGAEPRVKALAVAEGKSGACVARNQGAAQARGEWLLFFDSDDRLPPTTLERRMEQVARRPGIGLWLFRGRPFDEAPGDIDPEPPHAPLTAANLFASRSCYQTGGFFWRRSAFEALGGWDPTLAMWQDVDLLLRGLARLRWAEAEDPSADFDVCQGRSDSICRVGFFHPSKLRSRLRVLAKNTTPGSWPDAAALAEGLRILADQCRRAHQWDCHREVLELATSTTTPLLTARERRRLRLRACLTRLRLPVKRYSSPSS